MNVLTMQPGNSGSGSDFDTLNTEVQRRFERAVLGVAGFPNKPLFTTDTTDLYDTFIANLPREERQHHRCNACRHFLERFGGLVCIDETGGTYSAFWSAAESPSVYAQAIAVLSHLVSIARVTGVFLSSEKVWGKPLTGKWTHFAVAPPPELVFRHSLKTADQMMAEKAEDYKMLSAALAEFPPPVVDQAVVILQSDALYRSEKCLGVAMWLRDLHARRTTRNRTIRENVTWAAVASAPPGFCHVRSGMIGTLLEDVVAGLPFDEIARRFAEKMDPQRYQRPQAAPTAGNIAQAEKIFESMGLASALRRRFARLEEVVALWKPAPKSEEQPAGVFGHLLQRTGGTAAVSPVELPTQTMTWVKFLETVLPDAAAIQLFVPRGRANYAALVSAADPEARPILQWDLPERRNPVSWYVYREGSPPERWGLKGGSWAPVSAVCYQPSMWFDAEAQHQGQSVLFLLSGASDQEYAGNLALFPETLKAELHSVRGTIEAHSAKAVIEDLAFSSACGLRLQRGSEWGHVELRVTSKAGGVATYRLDRWD